MAWVPLQAWWAPRSARPAPPALVRPVPLREARPAPRVPPLGLRAPPAVARPAGPGPQPPGGRSLLAVPTHRDVVAGLPPAECLRHRRLQASLRRGRPG